MKTIEEMFRDLLPPEGREEVVGLALTPRSVAVPNNERLEFLGNAVLNMRLAEAIFERYPEGAPGTLSQMCNYLRSDPVLVMVGQEGGLEPLLRKQKNNEKGKVTDKMVSTAFEAIVGSIYLSAGYPAASRFIDELLLTEYLVPFSKNGKGPITELKELVDRDRMEVGHGWSESTLEGRKRFSHSTTVDGRTVTGEGNTKKVAEARAAAKALAFLRPDDLQQ